MVGAGAIISDYGVVGDWAIIGEGAVVRGEIPDGVIAVGVPAKIVRQVGEEHKKEWRHYQQLYDELAAERYPKGLKRIR